MEDSEIIELFFVRSEDAITALSEKYGAICHKVACNILKNATDAEECVNDTYLGVWNAIPPARPNPLISFVLRIVRNLSIKGIIKTPRKSATASTTLHSTSLRIVLAQMKLPRIR